MDWFILMTHGIHYTISWEPTGNCLNASTKLKDSNISSVSYSWDQAGLQGHLGLAVESQRYMLTLHIMIISMASLSILLSSSEVSLRICSMVHMV